MLKTPVIIINLKEYDEVLGEKPLKFAEIARKLSNKHSVSIVIAPPSPMIGGIANTIPTMSQHIDPFEPGAHTGAMLAKEVKELGAIGSLINHSEKRIPTSDIKTCIELCKKYGLISVVCSQTSEESKELAKFNPDFIAIEPPELIGGNICVSVANPGIISDTVMAVKSISPSTKVLCGAGVKHTDDVSKSIELGAEGILVASGVVKAPDVEKAMEELVMGML